MDFKRVMFLQKKEMAALKLGGRWSDGQVMGRGFPQPCLQLQYAMAIVQKRKIFEGRPGGGWIAGVEANDYVNFQVNGGRRLIVRVKAVHHFQSFLHMLCALGIEGFLPDFDPSRTVEEAAHLYGTFANGRGKYADLESRYGAVALEIEPVAIESIEPCVGGHE